ncbi:hypothetical protein [Methylobacterium indicum]|uniref:Sporulation protein n=1 Tax=Methylobacterium indicum TaxID=1775910 RepID=A0ABR5H7N7_9HYPH|nr:hypothetical protein [Methylobacterium indicum]KMO18269.1 hypothetical protein QR78_15490 [Methylobacterium indicum]KMO20415.1 hypothetical protein QR79_18285 [Methylobacterium indicum]
MSDQTRPGPLSLLPAIAAAGLLRLSGFRPASRQPEPDPGPHNPEGFEEEDVDVRRTAFVVAGLAASVGAAIGAVGLMMHLFGAWNVAGTLPLTPQQTARVQPPPPNLQGAPYEDLARYEARESARLTGYAPLPDGRARIPIDRAMRLVAGQSLDPVPPAAGGVPAR